MLNDYKNTLAEYVPESATTGIPKTKSPVFPPPEYLQKSATQGTPTSAPISKPVDNYLQETATKGSPAPIYGSGKPFRIIVKGTVAKDPDEVSA